MKTINNILCVCVLFLLQACTPQTTQTPQALIQTVEVTKVVEATRIVESTSVVVATPQPLTKIFFRQAWVPDDLYVPFTSALGMGYFVEEGIDFVNQVGSGAGTSTKVVASGSVPIGKGAANVVVQAISEGLPITIIMTEMQADATGVCSLPESNITQPKDLEGLQIATSPGDAGQPMIQSAMEHAGLKADSVNWVLMDPNLWNSALISKRVKAIGCYADNQPADLAAQGIKVNIITVGDLGLYVPGQVIFVNNDFLANNRDLVKKFLTAVLKGYQYENTHPAEAAKLMANYYPEVDAKVIETKIGLIKPSWFSPATDENGVGWSDPGNYESLQKLLVDSKVLTEPVDLSKSIDNSILESIPMELRTLDK